MLENVTQRNSRMRQYWIPLISGQYLNYHRIHHNSRLPTHTRIQEFTVRSLTTEKNNEKFASK